MATIAMKFGGTSVADIERIRHVAALVKREVERGNKVAVVVSAMSGETNKLVAWTNDAAKPEGAKRQSRAEKSQIRCHHLPKRAPCPPRSSKRSKLISSDASTIFRAGSTWPIMSPTYSRTG